MDAHIHEKLYIVLSVIAICANIVVLRISCRDKHERTVPNKLFANFMVCQIFYFICNITVNVLVQISAGCLLILIEARFCFIIATLFAILLVVIDWTLAAYFHSKSEQLRKYYMIALGFVWGISLISCIIRVIIDHVSHLDTNIHNFSFVFLYFLIFIFTSVIQIYRIKQICNKTRLDYSALILNLISVSLIIQLPFMIVITAFPQKNPAIESLEIAEICAYYIFILQPMVNLVIFASYQEKARKTFNRKLVSQFARYGTYNRKTGSLLLNVPFNIDSFNETAQEDTTSDT